MDITDFVKEQKHRIDNNQLDQLLIPVERVIGLGDEALEMKIGIEK